MSQPKAKEERPPSCQHCPLCCGAAHRETQQRRKTTGEEKLVKYIFGFNSYKNPKAEQWLLSGLRGTGASVSSFLEAFHWLSSSAKQLNGASLSTHSFSIIIRAPPGRGQRGLTPPGSWTSLDALVPPTRGLLPPGVAAAAEPCFAAGAAKPRRRAGSPRSAAVYRHFQVFVTPACTSQPFKLCCNFLLRLFDSCTTSLFYNKITLKCYWDAHWNIYSLLGNLASEMQAHENDGSDARSPLHSLASWRKGKKKHRYLKSKWPGEGEAAVSTWLSL